MLPFRFPSPVEFEALLVPLDDGVRLDDAQHRAPVRPEAREPDPEASVSGAQFGSFDRLFKHAELLSERKIFGRQGSVADDKRAEHEIQSLDQSQ